MLQKVPCKTDLVNIIMDILFIGKEAAYRRLREEVPFSLSEVATISQKLGISIDNLLGSASLKSKPFHLKHVEHLNPTEIDYAMIEEFVTILRNIKKEDFSEGGEATNILPQPLYLKHKHISRFYMFKWKNMHDDPNKTTSYCDIHIPERLRDIQLENVIVAQNVSTTNYIFDNLIFQYLANDLKYFKNIQLITDEECQLIKNDILQILSEFEVLSETGYFPVSKNKVNMYISNTNFAGSYCYIQNNSFYISMVKALILNGIASLDPKVFEQLKSWFNTQKQQSILITQSGERERISFFKKQRNIINEL